MTENEKKRSRRRFLADMLFVGGGISAAALLAKSRMVPDPKETPNIPEPPPDIAGAVAVPEGDMAIPDPQSTPAENPPMPGESRPVEHPPQMDGEMEMPVHIKGDAVAPVPEGRSVAPSPPPPKLGGKPMMPKHKTPPND